MQSLWSTYFVSLHQKTSRSPTLSLSLSVTLIPKELKMPSCMNIWFILMVSIPVIISLTNPRGESERSSAALHSVSSWFSANDEASLEYDFYRETCPQAEAIVRSSMARIYSKHKDVTAALLRLFFHDCFILVCRRSSSSFLLVLGN